MNSIKLVCFDLNKTLIHENSWLDLNLALGISREEDELLLHFYEEGIITYQEWVDLLLRLYKTRGQASRDCIEKTLSHYTYLPGAPEIVRYLQDKHYEIALISGSIDIVVSKVSQELGITLFEANHSFLFDQNNQLDQIVTFGQDDLAKTHHLESFCRTLGIQLSECACVGDGDNDRELFLKTGHGITFVGSKITADAEHVIDNLSEIRNIL